MCPHSHFVHIGSRDVMNVRALTMDVPVEKRGHNWQHKRHGLWMYWYIDGVVQERRNSTALAMELRLSCTNPSMN